MPRWDCPRGVEPGRSELVTTRGEVTPHVWRKKAADLQGSHYAPGGSPFGSPSGLDSPKSTERTPSDLRKRAPPGIRTQNLRSLRPAFTGVHPCSKRPAVTGFFVHRRS